MKIQNPFRLGLFGGLGVLVAVTISVVIGELATVLIYVGAALFLALGLDPLVSWLEKHKWPRSLAIVTVLVGVLGIFTGLIFAIIPVITEQINNAIKTVPELIAAFSDGTLRSQVEEVFPWLDVDQVLTEITNFVQGLDYTSIGGGILTAVGAVATATTGAIIVLILMIYFVSSLANIKRGLYQLVPASRRPKFIDISEQIASSVGRYVIGQVGLALVNGVLSFLVLTIVFPLFGIPVDYSALLAFIAFLGSLIPLVGTISGSIIITSLVLLFNGWPSVLAVGIYYLVYMQVEAYIVSPRIMASAVKVPGAIVVIAVVAGGTLLGVLGALIAIPVAASILLIIRQVVVPRQADL
ncbi:MAG TPA: AI-2E family transporter [Rhodoglobus sp.]|nr:AI-2E family transporter [Rhodoglobus sp.]